MLEWFAFQWSFDFVKNAFFGLFFLALAVAPISIFIIKRRMAFAAESMPHSTLPGLVLANNILIAVGLAASTFLLSLGAFLGMLVLVWLATALSWRSIFRNDAVLAAVFVFAFSFGIFLISVMPSPLNLQDFIMGDLLAITREKLFGILIIAPLSCLAMVFLYRPLVLHSQDPEFFGSVYRSGWWVSQAFMSLFTLVLISTLVAFGTLLAVSAAIFPGLIARCWSNSLPRIMVLSFLAILAAGWGGLLLSLIPDEGVPLGPTIVMALFGLWILSYLVGPFGLRLSLTSSSNRD